MLQHNYCKIEQVQNLIKVHQSRNAQSSVEKTVAQNLQHYATGVERKVILHGDAQMMLKSISTDTHLLKLLEFL